MTPEEIKILEDKFGFPDFLDHITADEEE